MRKLTAIISLLACAVALSGCQSPSFRVAQTPVAQMPELSPEIGTKRVPNLTPRLRSFLTPSPAKATTPSDN